MMPLQVVIQAFWFILPAYATNAIPPLLRGKRPLDFGKKWRGKRLLGDGKTLEGTFGGILFGLFIGWLQLIVQAEFQQLAAQLGLVQLSWPLIIVLACGAMAGDLIGSFAKRRVGLPPGAPVPLLDQLGFLVFALLAAAPFHIPRPEVIIFLIIITPLLHWLANWVAWKIRIKRMPW